MRLDRLPLILAGLALAAAPLAAQTPVRVGQVLRGDVHPADPRDERGQPYDAYVIQGPPGGRVKIQVHSDDFSPSLRWGRVEQGEWTIVAVAEYGGSWMDRELVVTLPAGGEYQLRAGPDFDSAGTYDIHFSDGVPAAAPLRAGQLVQGALALEDFQGENGSEDHYLLAGAPGQSVRACVVSDDFVPELVFGRWRGERLEPAATDGPWLLARMDDAGEYHLVVRRSFRNDDLGPYTLRMAESEAAEPVDPLGTDCLDDAVEDSLYDAGLLAALEPALPGVPVQAALDADDPEQLDSRYQDFRYTARAGERLVIKVTGDGFVPWVTIGTGTEYDFEILEHEPGIVETVEMELTVPHAGDYVIRVSPRWAGETGAFTLLVTPAP